eukprot:14185785-Ditylum_brightwellii.AAC.1
MDTDHPKNEWGITDIRKLHDLPEEDYQATEDPNTTNTRRRRLIRQLQHMIVWMRYWKSEHDELPETIKDWKIKFNEDVFNGVEDGSIIMKKE